MSTPLSDDAELHQPQHGEGEDLPLDECAGGKGDEDHLADPVLLLFDGGVQHLVPQQRDDEQQQHGEQSRQDHGAEAAGRLAVGVGVDRRCGDRANQGRGARVEGGVDAGCVQTAGEGGVVGVVDQSAVFRVDLHRIRRGVGGEVEVGDQLAVLRALLRVLARRASPELGGGRLGDESRVVGVFEADLLRRGRRVRPCPGQHRDHDRQHRRKEEGGDPELRAADRPGDFEPGDDPDLSGAHAWTSSCAAP